MGELARSLSLPERKASMSAVVVKAKFDSETLDTGENWIIRKGDLGVLKWSSHKRHPRFLEARVIWDRDPRRRVRRVILSSIAIVGLQTTTIRILLDSLPK